MATPPDISAAPLAHLVQLVQRTSNAVIITDPLQRITWVNEGFTRITGYTLEEVRGKVPGRILHCERTDPRTVEAVNAALQRGEGCRVEILNRGKAGNHYYLDMEILPLRDERGQLTGYVAIESDVTAAVAAREELQRSREQAEAATRAKSEFLATMSHEIRTPMNGVIGFTNLLLETPLSAEQRDFMRTIKQSAESLLAIINDILDFSKIEAGRLELEHIPFDAHRAALEVVELLTPRAQEKGLALRSEWSDAAPRHILGDPTRLRQVLINLIGNALKFTERGTVTLRVGRLPAGWLRVEVIDTGIGIAADKQSGLFQHFTQADSSMTRRFGGTGLGLAISKRLVELMGGQVGLHSELARGSTFWFTLPVPAAPVRAADGHGRILTPSQPLSVQRPLHLRVLLVEDNPINQKLALRLLQRTGCDVDLAVNGRAACDLTAARAYDLIFMDCHMPEMDGFEATRLIREREAAGRRTPIIALTADAMSGDRERCLAAGMDDYLSKPIKPTDLDDAIVRWSGAARPA